MITHHLIPPKVVAYNFVHTTFPVRIEWFSFIKTNEGSFRDSISLTQPRFLDISIFLKHSVMLITTSSKEKHSLGHVVNFLALTAVPDLENIFGGSKRIFVVNFFFFFCHQIVFKFSEYFVKISAQDFFWGLEVSSETFLAKFLEFYGFGIFFSIIFWWEFLAPGIFLWKFLSLRIFSLRIFSSRNFLSAFLIWQIFRENFWLLKFFCLNFWLDEVYTSRIFFSIIFWRKILAPGILLRTFLHLRIYNSRNFFVWILGPRTSVGGILRL